MGEAVDTIPSILNKCLFVSPDRRADRRTHTVIIVHTCGSCNIVHTKPERVASQVNKQVCMNDFLHEFEFKICMSRGK